MTTRRARSAERGLPTEVETFQQMTDVLQRVWESQQAQQQIAAQPPPPVQPTRPLHQFKAPKFDGTSDVEYFIIQFLEVAEANDWQLAASLLHLREALKDGAKDCGRAGHIDGVFASLRARYGLSPREARLKISVLRKDSRSTLQEHATEVDRLCQIAFHDLPDHYRASMSLETFCNTLGNTNLQRHLLAVQALTLEQAVRAGNEFVQIRGPSVPGSAIRAVDEEIEEEDRVAAVDQGIMGTLMKVLQQLSEKIDQLQVDRGRPNATKGKSVGCWGCGLEGHTRRNCPTHPWAAKPVTVTKAAGNGDSPQQ
jgi:hypothetical protein